MRRFFVFPLLILLLCLVIPAAAQTCTSPSGVPVTMCSPVDGSTVTSPVHEQIATNDPSHTITAIYTYVDNVVVRKDYNVKTVDAYLTIASGAHNIRVQVWDGGGNLFKAGANITVSGSAACTSPSGVSVTMCSPVNGATVTSPVHEQVATNDPGHTVKAIYTYVDNVVVRKDYNTPSVDAYVSIAAGTHTIRVQMWDNVAGIVYKAGSTITVTSGSTVAVSVSPTTASVATGATQQFQATVSGSTNTSVTWSVDGVNGGNATVGTVSSSGLYTAPSTTGSHTVIATSAADASKSASATVTVTSAGGTCTSPSGTVVTMCSPVNGSTVTSPVHEQVATNDPGHTVKAIYTYVDNVVVRKDYNTPSVDAYVSIAAGTHTIRVQMWDNVAGTVYKAGSTITVTSGTSVAVSVSPASATVLAGNTQQFTATVSNATNPSVTWSVDGVAGGNSTVGTVDSTGLYTAPAAAGNHSVTATSVEDTSKGGSASVKVTTASVAVSPSTATISPSQTQQFTAQVANTTNQNVTWQVDGVTAGNSTVGTVSASGLYTAPSSTGTHTVTAISQADPAQSGNATVHVTNFAGMFTYHGNNLVTGLNSQETILTPANVNTSKFGKLFTRATDGYVFAQPLYVRSVSIPNQGTYNVVYLATEHDSVYAYDADGAVTSALWHRSFINTTAGITTIPGADQNNYDEGPETGITGTPVIDPATKTMYLVAATKENGVYYQRLHALDLGTGAEKFGGPVVISGSVAGTGLGSSGGSVKFDPLRNNQRPSLTLSNGNVYIGFSSHGDQGVYHGWLFAYSASTLQRTALWCVSPNGDYGSIWGAGAGPAVDSSGNIYVVTSNGTFNLNSGGKDAGDSFVKLNPSFAVLDYFTPYDQSTLNGGDLDVGSAGLLLVPDAQSNTTHVNIAIGSNKRGDLYVIDVDSMGHYQSSSNTNIVQYLPRALGNDTASDDQYFGIGAYWNGNVYFGGAYDPLKQYTLANGLLSASPVAQSPEVLSTKRSSFPVISSNGNSNAIVWVISTDSGASHPTLRAYDATNVGHELYNSLQNASRDTPVGGILKFNSPTIANGRVYVLSQKNLDVYGLLP